MPWVLSTECASSSLRFGFHFRNKPSSAAKMRGCRVCGILWDTHPMGTGSGVRWEASAALVGPVAVEISSAETQQWACPGHLEISVEASHAAAQGEEADE